MLFYFSKSLREFSSIPYNHNIVNQFTAIAKLAIAQAQEYKIWFDQGLKHFQNACYKHGIDVPTAKRYIRMLDAWGDSIGNFTKLGIDTLLKLSTKGKTQEREEIIKSAIAESDNAENLIREKRLTRSQLNKLSPDTMYRLLLDGKTALRIEIKSIDLIKQFEYYFYSQKQSVYSFITQLLELLEEQYEQYQEPEDRWYEENC